MLLMKLAQAITETCRIEQEIEERKQRAEDSALTLDGYDPPEQPDNLLAVVVVLTGELEKLHRAINRTMLETYLPNGLSLADATVKLETYQMRREIIKDIIAAARPTPDEFADFSGALKTTIDVREWYHKDEELSELFWNLLMEIEQAIWNTDLIVTDDLMI